jgi:hypothetical protein
MLRSVLTIPLILLYFISYSQNKEVEVNSHLRYTVPEGKVLELTNTKFYKIILSDGVFRSGSSCNAIALSNPKHLYGISYYENIEKDERRPKTIGFTFKEIKHSHDDVYQVKPYFLLEENMNGDDITRSLNWKFQPQKIVFYPGMTVFPSSCIRSILLSERSMTVQERAVYNKIKAERSELKKAEEQRKEQERAQQKLQAQKAIIDKFNDINSIYESKDIYNLKQLKLSDSIISPMLNAVVLKINNSIEDEFLKMEREKLYRNSVSVIGFWNTNGHILSLRTEKTTSNNYKAPHLDLSEKDQNTINLRGHLNLKEVPLTEFEDKIRPCYFRNHLFTLNYFINGQQHFFIKKKANKIIYKHGNDSILKKEFDEALKLEIKNLPDGNHSFNFYVIAYEFKLLAGLFNDESTITIRKGGISPIKL